MSIFAPPAWSLQYQAVSIANVRCERAANQIGPAAMSDDATNIPVVLVAQAWDRGYGAGRHNLTHEANPYSVDTREWVA